MKDFKYLFKDKYREIAGLQVTQIRENEDFYLSMSKAEFKIMKPYIGQPKKILELGCGLGRYSVFLNSQLEQSPHFIMADFSHISKKIKYGWNPEESKYNNLELTKDFCNDNGLSNFTIFDLALEDLENLEDIDLVISVLSVGFHYPIELYINKLMKITSPKATMIFGVRSGIYDISDFPEFSEQILLDNPLVDTKEDILILRK